MKLIELGEDKDELTYRLDIFGGLPEEKQKEILPTSKKNELNYPFRLSPSPSFLKPRRDGICIGAYDYISHHHARGACEFITSLCFENRF